MPQSEFGADICIIGSGITGVLAAAKLSELTSASIMVIEAGAEIPPEQRAEQRQRWIEYGEDPWPGAIVPDQLSKGLIHNAMSVGGRAMHWNGQAFRFTREDFRVRSLYGVGDDWPIQYQDLEPYYGEAEKRIGISGEPGVGDEPRSAPYPMPPPPLDHNQKIIKGWAERAKMALTVAPWARNTTTYDGRPPCMRCDTCNACPIGARYSPDITVRKLVGDKKIQLLTNTLVRRLELDPKSARVTRAIAGDMTNPDRKIVLTAKYFLLAGSSNWTPQLLLLSACDRFPNGLANSSGLVGKYIVAHEPVWWELDIPEKIFPAIHRQNPLCTTAFVRAKPGTKPYVRFSLVFFPSEYGKSTGKQRASLRWNNARLRNDSGDILLADALVADWRARNSPGHVSIRAYVDVLPDRESRVSLDPQRKNRWGDPLPTIEFARGADFPKLKQAIPPALSAPIDALVAAGGKLTAEPRLGQPAHLAGGCRMGTDPKSSVCDITGRTHDHENVYVIGSPLMITAGPVNNTLSFVANALRTADFVAKRVAKA